MSHTAGLVVVAREGAPGATGSAEG
jgi:hypothetical protein